MSVLIKEHEYVIFYSTHVLLDHEDFMGMSVYTISCSHHAKKRTAL